ncbi:hypothetical protein JCM11251_004487 [Rhodosporidiobolus azoricus]
MHRFFSTSFEPLHAHIVDLLAEDGVHSLLPLLSVDREWRKLAMKRMLQVYSRTKKNLYSYGEDALFPDKDDGEYILCTPSNTCEWDGPFQNADPRCIFDEVNEGDRDGHAVPLFLPGKRVPGFEYGLRCDLDHEVIPEFNPRLEFFPSGWFREAKDGAQKAHCGLELAARADRHPPIGDYQLWPDVPTKPAKLTLDAQADKSEDAESTVTVMEEEIRNGWTVSYSHTRFDADVENLMEDRVDVSTCITIHEIKVPFIDLFTPRTCSEMVAFVVD